MAVVLLNSGTGEGIQDTSTGVKFQWTGKDYVPYFNFTLFGLTLASDLAILNATSTYDLSDFSIGHEVSFYFLQIENNGASTETGTWGINIYRKLTTGSEALAFAYNYNYSLPAGTSSFAWAGTGVDIDEEWDDIQYTKYEGTIDGSVVDTKTVTYTNLQTYSDDVLGSSKTGYFWVEGDNIKFVDGAYGGSRQAKHIIRHDGTSYSTGKTPGYIRVDTTSHGKLSYIDSSGVERKTYQAKNYWNTQQLGTGLNPGYIRVSGDTTTYSYLNFISYDGKHYCIINGEAVGYEGNNLV